MNSKEFWNFLNFIKDHRHPIPSLKHDNSFILDDSKKATIFNQFFHSVFTIEGQSSLSDLRQYLA